MRLSGRKPSSFTRRWTERQRVALVALISVNVAAFVVQIFVDGVQPGFSRAYLGISDEGMNNAYAWQSLTAIFLHDGPWHLLGNMLVLYLLGRDVESIIGQRHFILLYITGALAGELGHLFLMPSTSVLLAGSGGVAAVLMAYATILPELELTGMSRFIPPLSLKAKHLACGFVVIAVILICVDRSPTVVHGGFLGGCLAGWLYAHLLGFGRPSSLQLAIRHRRSEAERFQTMSADEFIAEQIDPLLDKISRTGMQSLTRKDRRILARVSEKLGERSR